jgi:hypothetical protein
MLLHCKHVNNNNKILCNGVLFVGLSSILEVWN